MMTQVRMPLFPFETRTIFVSNANNVDHHVPTAYRDSSHIEDKHWIVKNHPCRGRLPHPSWLQRLRFTLAPCLRQTPPCTTCLLHPSWLQYLRFTLAPCLTQTPPCFTILPHPSRLQYLRLLAPLSLPCLTPRTHLA